jgi:hypothetical protein
MRHRVLITLEKSEGASPVVLSGDCELDETYVLESMKGRKLPDDYWREPRKHGARASLRGLSHEQVCIMAGIERGGAAYAQTTNTASPGKADITSVHNGRIAEGARIFCDGLSKYSVLADGRDVVHASNHGEINTVNGFHSYIKNRHNNVYHGVATRYLNRYNALFAKAYRHTDDAVDSIINLLDIKSDVGDLRLGDIKTYNILEIIPT